MAREYPKLTGDDGKPFTITIDRFGKGVMTLYDESRLPQDAVYQSQNMILDQDGVWRVRPGTSEYGATLTTPIDGAGSYTKYNSDGTTDTYYWVVDNGAFKIAQDGGSWTTKSGVTWTTNKPISSKQINSRLYLGNGTDAMAYYDISAGTLNAFTSLSTPVAATVARTGLSAGSYTPYYRYTAVNAVGETAASTTATVSGGVNKPRDNWTTNTDYCTVTLTRVSNATRYNIYYGDASGTEVFLDSIADPGSGTTFNYIDYGIATPNPYQVANEIIDSTGGPKYMELALSGNRMWGTKDPNQPYRVGWTGTGQYMGAFNPYYGGGYIDLNKGGDERPEKVVHFRDGRGNAVATVFTSNPNGAGSTWHISLTTLTVDTLVIVVPQAYQQQGSVGTRSPRGVIEYKDSVYYMSPKGAQSTGSKQSILNVLVTTEISANIRDRINGINNAYAHLICGAAHEGRLLWSVPYGSTTNNETWVLDIERNQSWALPWTIGVKQFFEYTDTNGVIHLLAIPVSGTKLIEFDDETLGDSGTAFATNLESGLIHWDKNHATFARIEKVYCELARPKGDVTFTVSGIRKGQPLQTVGSIEISDTVSNAGIGADQLGDFLLGQTNEAPTTFSQSSVIKYIRLKNKMFRNLKWQFSSSSIDTRFVPLQVVIKGTILPTSDPSSFKAGSV